MSKKITIKVTLDKTADQELYNFLEPVFVRRRAENLRQLAKAGIPASLARPFPGVQGNPRHGEKVTPNKPVPSLWISWPKN